MLLDKRGKAYHFPSMIDRDQRDHPRADSASPEEWLPGRSRATGVQKILDTWQLRHVCSEPSEYANVIHEFSMSQYGRMTDETGKTDWKNVNGMYPDAASGTIDTPIPKVEEWLLDTGAGIHVVPAKAVRKSDCFETQKGTKAQDGERHHRGEDAGSCSRCRTR